MSKMIGILKFFVFLRKPDICFQLKRQSISILSFK